MGDLNTVNLWSNVNTGSPKQVWRETDLYGDGASILPKVGL